MTDISELEAELFPHDVERRARMAAPYVPPTILAEIERHARTQIRPERESVGYLTVENGIAVKYTRLRNWAKGDYTFKIKHFRHTGRILVHSHPGGSPLPSAADLSGANDHWLERLYAIFSIPSPRFDSGAEARLHFYVLHRDRKGFTEIP